MGLLDKANSTTPTAPAAAPVAAPVAAPAAVPVAAVAAQPVAKPAKAAKAKKAKKPKARPKGLPSEFEIASATARFTGSLANFIINYGPMIGAGFVSVFMNSTVSNTASSRCIVHLCVECLRYPNSFWSKHWPVRLTNQVHQFIR